MDEASPITREERGAPADRDTHADGGRRSARGPEEISHMRLLHAAPPNRSRDIESFQAQSVPKHSESVRPKPKPATARVQAAAVALAAAAIATALFALLGWLCQ